MMSNKYVLSLRLFILLVSIAIVIASNSASANLFPSTDSLNQPENARSTGADAYEQLNDLTEQITASENLETARTLALGPTDKAIDALKNARSIMPFSDDLQMAENRLSDARNLILLASSQEQVADEFSGIMLASLDDDQVAGVKIGKVSCNYSTGEVIAIVIGLILGIIPGLILLIVLC
jgi:hypothetical protein